ncbi:MAG TPA: hypothetical protein VNU46_08915 [Gemmatimonadaceae bacterium]|nr:hypothetical protein [Gemmatimonadaceae bacterium]
MGEGTGEPAGGAGDAETEEHTPVDVTTQQPEALRGGDDMRDRDRRDRELRPCRERQCRRQQAADAETGDGGDARRDEADDGDQGAEQHPQGLNGGAASEPLPPNSVSE